VHETDDSQHAAQLLKRTALAEGIHAVKTKPVLHGDNGATFKATTVFAMLHWLRIKPSYSRPRVSDDNAFVESLFRTGWAGRFVRWYNHDHLHSGIRYVSPADRHDGIDGDILRQRHAVYLDARARNPRRWARHTRNWSRIDVVTLNPERDEVIAPAATDQIEIQRSAASRRPHDGSSPAPHGPTRARPPPTRAPTCL